LVALEPAFSPTITQYVFLLTEEAAFPPLEEIASLAESFVNIDRRGEMWLEGANIPEYLNGTWNNHAPKRKRKLLLHAAQIAKLSRQTEAKGYTVVPLRLYFKGSYVKVEIALARGKKEFDKRAALREEQDKREALRAMRYRNLRAK